MQTHALLKMDGAVKVKNTFIEWASDDENIVTGKKSSSSWAFSFPAAPQIRSSFEMRLRHRLQQVPSVSYPARPQLGFKPPLITVHPAGPSPAPSKDPRNSKPQRHKQTCAQQATTMHSTGNSNDLMASALQATANNRDDSLSINSNTTTTLDSALQVDETDTGETVNTHLCSNGSTPTATNYITTAPAGFGSNAYTLSPQMTISNEFSFSDTGATTAVIRNVARSANLTTLINALNSNGFEGKYDFAHMPFRCDKGRNFGFGFINFCMPEYAQEFMDNKQTLTSMTGRKSRYVSVAPSEKQGREWCIQRVVCCLMSNAKKKRDTAVAFLDGSIVEFLF